MSSSFKDLMLAYFKGIACARGEIAGENEGENGLAEDRWITIHPWGMSQSEADTGEGKGYYRRIFIDDETGEIEKGLGAGTNIKDLSKTLKAKKNGEEAENTSKTDNSNLSDLAKKIKALTDGKEYTEEVANQVGDLMRQELEKNKDFKALIKKLDDKKNFKEEWKKIDESSYIEKDPKYLAKRNKLNDCKKELRAKGVGFYWHDEKYKQLFDEANKEYLNARERLMNDIAKKLNITDFDAIKNIETKDVNESIKSIFREQFKDVIDFNDGNSIKSSKAQKSNIENGLAMYSKEFIDALESNGIEVETLRKGCRSFFDPSAKNVNITLYDTYGTVAHEFAHALEHTIPNIRNMEKDFYERRTKGEQSVYLRDVTGIPQYGNEVTKLDKFLSPYIGKDYSRHGSVHGYELLSMGMTYLYNKPNELTKDKDYMNFVLGCLVYRG